MKKLVVTTLVAFVGFGYAVNAQTNATPAATPTVAPVNPNAADMQFEKDLHDFGNIKWGGNGVYDFKFKNIGKEPLIISNAQGSCGCTVPTWPHEPIKPGGDGVIKVSYDTKRNGPFQKTVTITSNAKTAAKVITIKGVVEEQPKEQTSPEKPATGGAPLETPKK